MNSLVTPVLAAGIMELNPGLTLWTAITFLVLIVVLGKFAWGPIVKMLDERERTIREAIDQAKKERAEAERMLVEQKASLAGSSGASVGLFLFDEIQVDAYYGVGWSTDSYMSTGLALAIKEAF